MSLLKTKQIAGPISGQHGSVILFDGGKAGWSSDLNGALMLPSGPTSARPADEVAQPGHIRHNSETGKLETFDGSIWTGVGISKFSELEDGPGAMAGKARQLVRVNDSADGLEFFPLPLANVVSYRFKVQLSGTIPATTNTFSEVPDGWNVVVNSDDITVTHNLGKTPLGGMYLGSQATAGKFVSRVIGTTASWIELDFNDLNILKINNVTTTNTGAVNSGSVYIYLWFTT